MALSFSPVCLVPHASSVWSESHAESTPYHQRHDDQNPWMAGVAMSPDPMREYVCTNLRFFQRFGNVLRIGGIPFAAIGFGVADRGDAQPAKEEFRQIGYYSFGVAVGGQIIHSVASYFHNRYCRPPDDPPSGRRVPTEPAARAAYQPVSIRYVSAEEVGWGASMWVVLRWLGKLAYEISSSGASSMAAGATLCIPTTLINPIVRPLSLGEKMENNTL